MTTLAPRRWWNYSLRTLLVAVTVISCYLAYQKSVVRSRQLMLQEIKAKFEGHVTTAAERTSLGIVVPGEKPVTVPLIRRWLGDEAIYSVTVYHGINADKRERIARLFPEASVQTERLMEPCHPGCFPHGTRVETPGGAVKIEVIAEGDTVFMISPGGEKKSVAVLSIFRTRNRLWEVETDRGTLLTTETQPLSVSATESQAVGKLRPGDKVLYWADDSAHEATVQEIRQTDRIVPVINLVLGNREPFIANGYLARSKPPKDEPSRDIPGNIVQSTTP